MYLEILNQEQKQLFPLVVSFKQFYLAGGTALALQFGHRKSIDFDLFCSNPFVSNSILRLILEKYTIESTLVDNGDELTIVVNGVKFTFLHYPFNVQIIQQHEIDLRLPPPLTIGAMKAYALGRRAKWKDYVDLYFILQNYSLEELISNTKEIFGSLFNDKNFREQLCYYDDIDYTEAVEYVIPNPPSDDEVKKFLCNVGV